MDKLTRWSFIVVMSALFAGPLIGNAAGKNAAILAGGGAFSRERPAMTLAEALRILEDKTGTVVRLATFTAADILVAFEGRKDTSTAAALDGLLRNVDHCLVMEHGTYVVYVLGTSLGRQKNVANRDPVARRQIASANNPGASATRTDQTLAIEATEGFELELLSAADRPNLDGAGQPMIELVDRDGNVEMVREADLRN